MFNADAILAANSNILSLDLGAANIDAEMKRKNFLNQMCKDYLLTNSILIQSLVSDNVLHNCVAWHAALHFQDKVSVKILIVPGHWH